jgi:LysR family transcriptional activator of nhaA
VEWLNYHHLLYFYLVAREGGLGPAARILGLSHPTLSSQIRTLEDALGEKLFSRSGRRLVLTEVGQVAYRYADEIFGLGGEMLEVMRGRSFGRTPRLHVGVSDALPKLVVSRLLSPAWRLPEPVALVVREGRPEALLLALAQHTLDFVLMDVPVGAGSGVRAFNHLLGECDVTVFGTPALAWPRRRRFPASLDGAPMILPTENSALRRSLELWFETQKIRPLRVAEVEDGALIKVLGQEGLGLFCAPSVMERDVRRRFGVEQVGRIPEIRERFYAVTVERRLRHPAVAAVCKAAREETFGGGTS